MEFIHGDVGFASRRRRSPSGSGGWLVGLGHSDGQNPPCDRWINKVFYPWGGVVQDVFHIQFGVSSWMVFSLVPLKMVTCICNDIANCIMEPWNRCSTWGLRTGLGLHNPMLLHKDAVWPTSELSIENPNSKLPLKLWQGHLFFSNAPLFQVEGHLPLEVTRNPRMWYKHVRTEKMFRPQQKSRHYYISRVWIGTNYF